MKIRVYVKKNNEGNLQADVEDPDVQFMPHAYDRTSTGKNQFLEFLHLVESTALNFVTASSDTILPTTVIVTLGATAKSFKD